MSDQTQSELASALRAAMARNREVFSRPRTLSEIQLVNRDIYAARRAIYLECQRRQLRPATGLACWLGNEELLRLLENGTEPDHDL